MENDFIDTHYRRADKMMFFITIGLFVFSCSLATVYNTWMEAIFIGGGTVLALGAIKLLAPGSTISRVSNGIAFMVMAALQIHQFNGMIEFHFSIFVLLAILLFYRDWLPIVVAAITTAIHHASFFYLQSQGLDVWILPSTDQGFLIIVLHAGFVVVESTLLVSMAISQKREYKQFSEIISLTKRIVRKDVLDLSCRSSGDSEMLERFDDYTEAVANLARNVRDTSETLKKDGLKLSLNNQYISRSAKEQKSQTDEISNAMEDFRSSVNQITEIASKAAVAANNADENAKEGARVNIKTRDEMEALSDQIGLATETVTELKLRSSAIGGVLDVIRNIAEQTNLLALNAAIEAARAGDQGRGFAVVADEVRTLAQRTQESTQEIDAMIEGLQQETERSVEAIETSKTYVASCVDSVKLGLVLMSSVTTEIDSIANNSREIAEQTNAQLSSLVNISDRVDNITRSAGESVSKSIVAADSSEMIVALSQQLSDVTNRFKL